MTMYLRRRVRFSAGIGGARTEQKASGHDYLCELTVGGDIDPVTGTVINIVEIDSLLKAHIVAALNETILDRDIPVFCDTPPTIENLAQYIWDRCELVIPRSVAMKRVDLQTDGGSRASLMTDPRSEGLTMLTVTRFYDFSASHRLHAPKLSDAENATVFGKCNWPNGHGHNYEIEVCVTGESNPNSGELIAPADLDHIVEEFVLKRYDHKHLNLDAPEFAELNPTSENLTKVIWQRLKAPIESLYDGNSVRLYRIVVRETARNAFEYYGESS